MKAPALHFFSYRSSHSEREPEGLKGGKPARRTETVLEMQVFKSSQSTITQMFSGVNWIKRICTVG